MTMKADWEKLHSLYYKEKKCGNLYCHNTMFLTDDIIDLVDFSKDYDTIAKIMKDNRLFYSELAYSSPSYRRYFRNVLYDCSCSDEETSKKLKQLEHNFEEEFRSNLHYRLNTASDLAKIKKDVNKKEIKREMYVGFDFKLMNVTIGQIMDTHILKRQYEDSFFHVNFKYSILCVIGVILDDYIDSFHDLDRLDRARYKLDVRLDEETKSYEPYSFLQ